MRKKSLILVLLGILVVMIYLTKGLWRPSDPAVVTAVAKLEKLRRQAHPSHGEPTPAPSTPQTVSAAPASILAAAVALSSFLPTDKIAGLSEDQLVELEAVFQGARRSTYALLVEKAWVSQQPGGGIHIEIPAQGDGLKEMRDFVYASIEKVVGEERMASLEDSLGPKFDAKFAYFGEYETKIDLSFDGKSYPAQAPDYVTMHNQYDGMRILGGTGRITSTHVLRLNQFDRDFIPLNVLQPKG